MMSSSGGAHDGRGALLMFLLDVFGLYFDVYAALCILQSSCQHMITILRACVCVF